MALERAAELVSLLRQIDRDAGIDLFCHFDDYFKFDNSQRVDFAVFCGYGIATNVRILEKTDDNSVE